MPASGGACNSSPRETKNCGRWMVRLPNKNEIRCFVHLTQSRGPSRCLISSSTNRWSELNECVQEPFRISATDFIDSACSVATVKDFPYNALPGATPIFGRGPQN